MNDIVVDDVPEIIEFGGLVWRRDKSRDSSQYRVFKGDIEFRIYRYPEDGTWLWSADFRRIIPDEIRESGLELHASAIVLTRNDAMECCINALDNWLNAMQRVLLMFRPGEQYARGFLDGQEDIKDKVREVVR